MPRCMGTVGTPGWELAVAAARCKLEAILCRVPECRLVPVSCTLVILPGIRFQLHVCAWHSAQVQPETSSGEHKFKVRGAWPSYKYSNKTSTQQRRTRSSASVCTVQLSACQDQQGHDTGSSAGFSHYIYAV